MNLITTLERVATFNDLDALQQSLKNYDDKNTKSYLDAFPKAITLAETRNSIENSLLSKTLLSLVVNAALYFYVGSLKVLNIVKLTIQYRELIDLDGAVCVNNPKWLILMSKNHTIDMIKRLGWQIPIEKAPKLRSDLRKEEQIISVFLNLENATSTLAHLNCWIKLS